MSATPGKVVVLGTQEIHGEKVFILSFLRGRKREWVGKPFFAKFDPRATWLDQLRPALGETHFFFDDEEPLGRHVVAWVLLGGVIATGALVAMELASKGSRHVELAIHNMTKGTWSQQFWIGGVLVGLVVPAVLAVVVIAADITNPILLAVAGVAALVGMYAYEDSFVRAGQSVPLS